MSHAANDSFIAINRLLAAGEEVAWLTSGPSAGAFFIAGKGTDPCGGRQARCRSRAAASKRRRRGRRATRCTLRKLRIALADQYGGSMPSGWTRWILEQFEFPFEVVYPQALDAGTCRASYDVIIFPSGVGPAAPGGGGRGWRRWGRGRRRPRRRQPSEHPRGIPGHARRLYGGRDRSTAPEVPRGLAARSWRSGARR